MSRKPSQQGGHQKHRGLYIHDAEELRRKLALFDALPKPKEAKGDAQPS